MKLPTALTLLIGAVASAPAANHTPPVFKKILLTDQFWSEGADFGDINHDGAMDVVSGPFWYKGPDFTERYEYRPATNYFTRKTSGGAEEKIPGFEGALGIHNAYSDDFFTFVYDFNRDGWPDILIYGFPGTGAYLYLNPRNDNRRWERHEIFDAVDNESPAFTDLTGDGRPEIVCNSRGYFGYAQADWSHPTRPWTFHRISPKGPWGRFQHGLGVGDVNGDGRMDILEKDGWWEQPASLANDPTWRFHPFQFAPRGAAQMYAYDVNGDGLNDVITCLNPHGYGLAWYQQVRTGGKISFEQHLILNPGPTPNRYGVSFTQPHSMALMDMNGDGLKDIVTGKRFWAHGKNGPDPESHGHPAVLYWFQLVRGAKGQADFVPHLVDDDSGVGTQVVAGRIQKNHLPGIVVGNKKGTFVFLNESESDHGNK